MRVPETKAVARSWSPAEWWAELRDDAMVTFSGADLRQLAEVYQPTKAVANAEEVIIQLAALRDVLERLMPTLDYFRASAIYSYLRPISDLVDARTRDTYPWRKEGSS